MTARTVLLIESAILTPDTAPTALSLLADRRDDGGLTLTTLDEATRIELRGDDLAALLDYAGMRPKPMVATPDPPVVTLPTVTPHSPPRPAPARPRASREGHVQASLAHIRSIAQDGVMPIIAQYNRTRPAESFSSGTLRHHLDCKWSDIAAQLGLALTPAQQHGATRSDPLAPKADPEPEPEPAPEPLTQTVTRPVAESVTAAPGNGNGRHATDAAAARRAALRDEACAALRGMGNGNGRMPSMSEYNARKPADLPRAGELMAALAVDHWGEMARHAGLVWKPGQK